MNQKITAVWFFLQCGRPFNHNGHHVPAEGWHEKSLRPQKDGTLEVNLVNCSRRIQFVVDGDYQITDFQESNGGGE
jgi:hypothetical protein